METILEQSGPGDSTSPLRASSYVIYVDLPNVDDHLLIVHGYTGAYDKVSRSVAAYVRSLEIGNVHKPLYGAWEREEIAFGSAPTPSDATIERLRRRGYLTSKSVEDEGVYFDKHVSSIHFAQMRNMPSYVIMPTYDCNLRCAYCFQDHMRTDSKYSHLLRVMTPSMADKLLGSLASIESRHGVELGTTMSRSFMFFGGEPLLRGSRPVVEHLIRRAKQLGSATFSAITNATQLEHYEDLLGAQGISWLQITLDGPPADHDKRRIHADGSGSFEAIARNLTMALERGATVSVRMNVDRSNVSSLPDAAQVFVDHGWSEHPKFSAYVAPVNDYSETGKRGEFFNSWELAQSIAELLEEYPAMAAISPVDDSLKARAMQIFTRQRGGIPERTSFCGAHRGMYIFDAFGDIYACWDRTGDKNIRIGRIGDDGNVEMNEISDMWRSRTVTTNSTCRSCRFALHCGGGCAILAEQVSGTKFSNYCDAFGKRYRAKVAEAYVEYSNGNSLDEAASARAAMREFVL